MDQWLSKSIIVFLSVLFAGTGFSQPATGGYQAGDYKDPKSHEKFRARRMAVAQWQINELKKGALVVRLKTNHLLISELQKRGENTKAEKARLEQAAVNLNMMKAFLDNYKFSKVYFIYSNSSDSLVNGTTTGIFIDTTLSVSPSISLPGNFYLLAETDFVYNSSIGFVPEDSARHVSEQGNPSSAVMPIVLKNKYGHQLKNPFPYSTGKFVFTKNVPNIEIFMNGKPYVYNVRSFGQMPWNSGNARTSTVNNEQVELSIPREMTYDVLKQHVEQLDADLEAFYRSSAGFSEKSRNFQESQPFFY
jgi:hypothetical protein